MTAPAYFTRHLLKTGLGCATKLYYYHHDYPQDKRLKPMLRHAGFNKHHLKKLASRKFTDAVLIDDADKNEAAERTATLCEKDHITLLNAQFIADRCFSKVPILKKRGHHVQLIDVQTKAINPKKHRLKDAQGKLYTKWRSYIIDLAYKIYVLEQQLPEVSISAALLLPNKKARARNDRLLQKVQRNEPLQTPEDLFYEIECTHHAHQLLHEGGEALTQPLKNEIKRLQTIYFEGKRLPATIGKKCGRCEFRLSARQQTQAKKNGFEQCWSVQHPADKKETALQPVIDLIGPGVEQYVQAQAYWQHQAEPGAPLSMEALQEPNARITHRQRQLLQIEKAKGHEVPKEIIKSPVKKALTACQYPFHFLDFEAGNYAVPLRAGARPYHPVLFQFSCHTLHQDGRLEHHQWLADGSEDYENYALIRQLRAIPGIQSGTIFQYSQFEQQALKGIRKELRGDDNAPADAPELMQWIKDMAMPGRTSGVAEPQIVDISRFVKRFYYNCYMNNSLSIKDVIQAVLSVSDTLKIMYEKEYSSDNIENIQFWQYDTEAGQAKNPYVLLQSHQPEIISGGTQAIVNYAKLLSDKLSQAEHAQIRRSLLQYCELDTLALVMLVQHWKQAVGF